MVNIFIDVGSGLLSNLSFTFLYSSDLPGRYYDRQSYY